MIAKIVHTAKQTVKAIVDIQSARDLSRGAAPILVFIRESPIQLALLNPETILRTLICRNLLRSLQLIAKQEQKALIDLHQCDSICVGMNWCKKERNAVARQHLTNGDSSGLQSILNALVQSIRKYRQQRRLRNELTLCSVAEISAIARDLRLSPDELMKLVSEKTETAAALHELLAVVGIEAKSLKLEDPAVMRELQRQCLTCCHKSECAYHLAQGTAIEHYQDYCPNTYALEDLTTAKTAAWRGRSVESFARRNIRRLHKRSLSIEPSD